MKETIKIFISSLLFATGAIFPGYIGIALFVLSFGVCGYEVIWNAVCDIRKGEFFGEELLMSVASIGAICIGEYPEAAAVMILFQIGEMLQHAAEEKSRSSIKSLMNIAPDTANLYTPSGIVSTAPEDVAVGDIIYVKNGQRVPLDGVLEDEAGIFDTSALTGESLPYDAVKGNKILSGSINSGNPVKLKVSAPYGESTVARIISLVSEAEKQKSVHENFITKFARYYTPIVMIIALLTAVIPSIIFGNISENVYRALTFLVISCPCALVISVPLAFFAGIGRASKAGVLIKGGKYMQALSRTKTVVFDKTGTLTYGNYKIDKICPQKLSEDELLMYAAYAESISNHPLAKAITASYGKAINPDLIKNQEETAGYGVCAVVDGKKVLAGNLRMMEKENIKCKKVEKTCVYIAIDGKFAGSISLCDDVKESASDLGAELKKIGVKKTVILSGDKESEVKTVAEIIGADEYTSGLLPEQKVEKAKQLISENTGGTLMYVGDGINDAPVLSVCDIGVAMGGIGSDCAVEAADVVIMSDNPAKIKDAVKISRRTLSIAKQNIVLSIGIKVLIMTLGIFGLGGMWQAVFADVGVCLLAILNSVR